MCEIEKCPIDCVVSDWEDQGSCSISCGGGVQTQVRTIQTPAEFNGVVCPTDLIREVGCNPQECPVDCVMSNWTDDGSCSVACGTGELKQVRSIQVQSAHGGLTCEGDLNQTIDCNTDPCPINCEWGPFGGWGDCSQTCGLGGTRERNRTEAVTLDHGGEPCEGDANEFQACNEVNCPVDCELEDWPETWSDCDEECGDGFQFRNRGVKTEAAYQGAACTGDVFEEKSCKMKECAIDCVMGNWSDVAGAECSATCGGGTIEQERDIIVDDAHDGLECPAVNE